jgi:hypothetical protein
MRQLFRICLIALASSAASAHTLAPDAGIVLRLGHQLFGSHHLPLLLLLLASFVAYLYSRTRSR